ncbi:MULTISPECIES: FtsK/SpoIIIE domain-containing protein [unclassified Parafrankia]|uniref:FtsK/SpoIIIE domain-containing protein n=1 Tax=Parafrankia TaxID=2994362 RepID=UPI000DA443CB|nr:FtsK/SpoIIIE domain-containing protein [Parafrankia sp. BMG5.11]TCJ31960.1 DNA translocase FtsK [Parafrankia sp. BMG5.11]SQE00473.1 Cell divisionFtsK/SpoIIIE (modular protein) [Parafrankia sp. Ea1.12]
MSEAQAGREDLIQRLQRLRADADRIVGEADRAVNEADAALAGERDKVGKKRSQAVAKWADWRAREVESRVTEVRDILVSRPRLWETEEGRQHGPVPEHSATEVVDALALAVRRLRSPLRSKRHWTRVAVAAVRRADELIVRATEDLDAQVRTAAQNARASHGNAVAAAKRAWRQSLALFQAEVAAVRADLDGISLPADADWSTWSPVSTPVDGLRIGWYIRAGHDGGQLVVPALLPFPRTTNLVVKAGRANTEHSDVALGLIGRMLASIPPGQLRLSVVDSISLGRSVRSLSGLNSTDVRLMETPLIDYHEIEGRLAELVGRIGRIERDLLGPHRLDSLVDYNQLVDARPEPYHVVVVFDYPRGFTTPDSLTRLDQVMANGPRCGVYTVLMITDDDPEHPHHLELVGGGRARPGPAAAGSPAADRWELVLEHPREPTWETSRMLGTIVDRVADRARDAGKVVVSLDRVLSLVPAATRPELGGIAGMERPVDAGDPATWWQGDASDGLVIPIGTYSLDDVMAMRLGEGTRNHVMVAGTTGSGKTTLLHTIVLAAATVYSPAELELYLVDLKQGIEFQDYAVRQLPHARQVAIHSEREFGLETMRTLLTEIDFRAELFKKYGVEKLANYRSARARAANGASDPRLARILLVVDEFHVLFDVDDAVGRDAAASLETLVRMGRAYGIHVLLSSQTPSSPVVMGGSTVRQMEVRVALRCDDQVSRRVLAENNPSASQLGLRGEAIYNPSSGQLGRDTKFQIAFIEAGTRTAMLGAMRKLAHARHHVRVPAVYDGDRPGDITRDGIFEKLARAQSTPAKTIRIWLGEPMGLSAPVCVDLTPSADRTMLVIGDDAANVGVLTSTAAALATLGVGRSTASPDHADHADQGAQAGHADHADAITLIDFTPVDHRYTAVHAELGAVLPGLRRWSATHCLERIESLADLVRKRHADDAYTMTSIADCRVLILNGLHRCRELDSSPKGYGAAGVGVPLSHLLEQGSEVGVFVIATIDRNGLRRVHRDILNQFGIVLTRRYSDSFDDRVSALIGRPTARLRDGQAVLVDDGSQTRLRPYGIPPPGWLKAFGETLP